MGNQNSAQNYACRNKANTKPFSFRWEIEHFPLRLTPYGDFFDSPIFDVGDGVPMFVRICRNKSRSGIDYLSVELAKSPVLPDKKVKLVFSVTLINSQQKNNHTLKEDSATVFDLNPHNEIGRESWGRLQFIAYHRVANKNGGFLKDGHLLTLLVEGKAIVDDGPLNFDWKSGDEVSLGNDTTSDTFSLWKELGEDFGKMFDEGAFSDFVVKAKDAKGMEKELKVHRNILAARSEPFAAMLTNPETKECREGMVEIEDIQFDVMEALIRFMYSGKILQSEGEGNGGELELLIAADKYGILGLKKQLERVLAAKLSVEKACEILVIAERHKAPFLAARCREFIREKAAEVAKSDGWRQLCAPENSELMAGLFVP